MSAPGTTGWRWADLHDAATGLARDGHDLDEALEHLAITYEGLRSAFKRHGTPMPTAWTHRAANTNLRRWEALREDADWLARTGCSIDRAAERLGVNRGSLVAAYRRHNEPLPLAWRVDG